MELQIFVRFCQSLEKRGSTALVILQLLELLEVAVHCSTSRFFDQQKHLQGIKTLKMMVWLLWLFVCRLFFLSFVSFFQRISTTSADPAKKCEVAIISRCQKSTEMVGLRGIVQTEETEALAEPALWG